MPMLRYAIVDARAIADGVLGKQFYHDSDCEVHLISLTIFRCHYYLPFFWSNIFQWESQYGISEFAVMIIVSFTYIPIPPLFT
jgi:hypothetical protein